MTANPKGDWSIEDIKTVCGYAKAECSPPKRGDHYKISHPNVDRILTVPAARPIKPHYIRELVGLLAEAMEAS